MTKATGLAFCLSPKNPGFLHVGRADSLPGHLGVDGMNLVEGKELEIYNANGQQLAVDTASGERELAVPEQLGVVAEGPPRRVRTDGGPMAGSDDSQVLLDRITLALAMIQVDVNGRDEDDFKGYRVPIVQASLPVVLAALAEEFGEVSENDSGGGKLHRASPHPHG
jgi:hypothetical protein